ncbi:MAG: hypothetical protein VB858_22405 [Planctomycetaceae bacterium]
MQRMNERRWTSPCALLVSVFLLSSASVSLADSPLRIVPVNDRPDGFSRLFNRQIDVFGLTVYATENVPDTKLTHAAGVLAQYLDNDADTQPDNPLVIRALRKSKGVICMFESERVFERLDIHRHIPERVWNEMLTIGLFAEETLPGGASRGRFDATLEEVLHLVTSGGYSLAYPEIFGERRGSEIARAMDKARGGYFRQVPRQYPRTAWYSYDDRSCDYTCQITEYFYWGLTSLLGAQKYPGRGAEIRREWKLNTAEKLKRGDPALYRLLTDSKYRFPTQIPDGRYNPRRGSGQQR